MLEIISTGRGNVEKDVKQSFNEHCFNALHLDEGKSPSHFKLKEYPTNIVIINNLVVVV